MDKRAVGALALFNIETLEGTNLVDSAPEAAEQRFAAAGGR
jgi:hypothetical protein